MQKRILKIYFVDFWGGFNPVESFLYQFLLQEYEIELTEKPDYLFFSCFGNEHFKFKDCIKIFFTGENVAPDFNIADYALAFDSMQFGDRYFRFPLFYSYASFETLRARTHFVLSEEERLHRKFCSYVVSNPNGDPVRDRFYKLLNEYKQVDCGGRLYNNVGGPVKDKLSFIRQYKFNIAFENSCVAGYTTEKLMEPFVAETLPIYWGNPDASEDFKEESFVNVHQFKTLEDAVEYVVQMDKNDELYLSYFRFPEVVTDSGMHYEKHLMEFFHNIFDCPKSDAQRISDKGFQGLYQKKQRQAMSYYDTVLKMKVFLSKWKGK